MVLGRARVWTVEELIRSSSACWKTPSLLPSGTAVLSLLAICCQCEFDGHTAPFIILFLAHAIHCASHPSPPLPVTRSIVVVVKHLRRPLPSPVRPALRPVRPFVHRRPDGFLPRPACMRHACGSGFLRPPYPACSRDSGSSVYGFSGADVRGLPVGDSWLLRRRRARTAHC